MSRRTLSFRAPREVAIETAPVPDPGPDQMRVETIASAISAGTEGLVYRGEAPTDLPNTVCDGADLTFPLSYGYAAVGRVDAVGADVDDAWIDRRVFAYNPHESHFLAAPDAVVPVPERVSTREATLLANAETAVNLVLDGTPTLGERVVVFGQGVVGLFTTTLLSNAALDALVTVDELGARRRLSERFGADCSIDPAADPVETIGDCLDASIPGEPADEGASSHDETPADDRSLGDGSTGRRADLTYELSGDPAALDDAVAATGFDGRIVVGSWYGTKSAELDLGGRFHRDRIDLRSSQVSTIAPEHSGRWSRARRHATAWSWLQDLDLEPLFTHEFPLDRAEEAYRLIDDHPEEALQVLLTYE